MQLRESIGRHDLAQMVAQNAILMGHELQKILDEKKMTPFRAS